MLESVILDSKIRIPLFRKNPNPTPKVSGLPSLVPMYLSMSKVSFVLNGRGSVGSPFLEIQNNINYLLLSSFLKLIKYYIYVKKNDHVLKNANVY